MGIFELAEMVIGHKKWKWKVIFSTSTSDSPMSISGQLGYYEMKGKAIADMADRLYGAGSFMGLFGSAKLYKKVDGKWKLDGYYCMTQEGKLFKKR